MGVIDFVPAARTVLLMTYPAVSSLADVERAVRLMRPRHNRSIVG